MSHKIHFISIMSSLSSNKKRIIVTSSLSSKKKRKILSSSTASGNNSMVYLHGKEHSEGIFIAYFSISLNGSNGDRSFFILPFENAAKKFMSNRTNVLYPDSTNLFDFGSLFRVDNCYFRSAHGSHTEYRRQKRDSNFYWPCFVWTRPDHHVAPSVLVHTRSPAGNKPTAQDPQGGQFLYCVKLNYNFL